LITSHGRVDIFSIEEHDVVRVTYSLSVELFRELVDEFAKDLS